MAEKKVAKTKKVANKAEPEVSTETEIVKVKSETNTTQIAKSGKRSAKAAAESEAEIAKSKRKAESEQDKPVVKKAEKRPRSKLERRSKSYRNSANLIDYTKQYDIAESIDLALKTNKVKFDSTIEIHANLNIDPKKAEQNVRDQLQLPGGSGKTIKVAVYAEADESKKAKAAGADIVGAESIKEMLDKQVIKFDSLIATPSMMASLSKYAKLLGPRGLMPNPKSGTVTADPVKAVSEIKAGRVEYRSDSYGIIHLGIGKSNMDKQKLIDNANAALASIRARRPASV